MTEKSDLRERAREWNELQDSKAWLSDPSDAVKASKLITDLLQALDDAEREERELSEDQVLKTVYESGLHQYVPDVLREVWKDGIEIDKPVSALMNFARKIAAIRREGGKG